MTIPKWEIPGEHVLSQAYTGWAAGMAQGVVRLKGYRCSWLLMTSARMQKQVQRAVVSPGSTPEPVPISLQHVPHSHPPWLPHSGLCTASSVHASGPIVLAFVAYLIVPLTWLSPLHNPNYPMNKGVRNSFPPLWSPTLPPFPWKSPLSLTEEFRQLTSSVCVRVGKNMGLGVKQEVQITAPPLSLCLTLGKLFNVWVLLASLFNLQSFIYLKGSWDDKWGKGIFLHLFVTSSFNVFLSHLLVWLPFTQLIKPETWRIFFKTSPDLFPAAPKPK